MHELETIKDEEILEKSLENPRFFEMIVDKYQDSFLRTAMRILRNKEESEDAVQNAFVKIYFNAKKFEKRPGIEFKSWAFKILVNCSLTRYRKLKRDFNSPEYNDQVLYILEDNRGSSFEHSEQRDLIESVFQKMPSDLSDLLREHYLDDKPYAIIASSHEMSINALKMKLFRARKSFKRILEENE